MKKRWLTALWMTISLLLPGTAAIAEDITVAGQFEGAYADDVYRFVTTQGREIPAIMENAGKIMSYTPFQATGYIAYNDANQPVFVIRNVSYEERKPNQRTVSYRNDVAESYSRNDTTSTSSRRDAGYYVGPVKSDVSSFYQVNPGNLTIEDIESYQLAWDLSGVPIGTKIYTVGSVISTAGTGLMNFRTAEGTMILVNLNGTVVPMGQRVTALGVVTSPAVLTVQFMVSG